MARRSGDVGDADLARTLPGDSVVQVPWHVVDRAAVLPAPAAEVWPWLLQVGKGRGGWYAPRWLQTLLGGHPRSLRTIDPQMPPPRLGAMLADWGPGSLEVLQVEENQLVYGSVIPDRPRSDGGYHFSWLFLVEPLDDRTSRLYTRLRFAEPQRRAVRTALRPLVPIAALPDYITFEWLFAGLRERVREAAATRGLGPDMDRET
ncbi:hypothetical protein [Streptacidiphilus jiangxiensis]|uniref:hypothetical protein n=1 Tax=Streptacidiphilus jiangxiensis TaxID=235985 RepID=UPI000A91A25B|nr:hypothetical protein [Streptacidiphilus jiangxiensis]